MRTHLVGALLLAITLLSACSAPTDAAVTRCEGGVSQRTCTVMVERFDKPASATFRSASANLGVDIHGSFTLRSGSATVALRSGEGVVSEVSVSAGQPAEITASTRLNRGNRNRDEDPFFTLQVTPHGLAEGFSGEVHYQARPQNG